MRIVAECLVGLAAIIDSYGQLDCSGAQNIYRFASVDRTGMLICRLASRNLTGPDYFLKTKRIKAWQTLR